MAKSKSKVWSALKFEGLEQDKTQRYIAEAIGLTNDNLWKSIENGSTKLNVVCDICDELGVELIIRNKTKKREHVLND